MYDSYNQCQNCKKTLKDVEIKKDKTCVYCGGRVKKICTFSGYSSDYSKTLPLEKIKTLIDGGFCYKGRESTGEYDEIEYCLYLNAGTIYIDSIYTYGGYGDVKIKNRHEVTSIAEDGTLSLSKAENFPKIIKGKPATDQQIISTKMILTFSDINDEYAHIIEENETNDKIFKMGCVLNIGTYSNQSKQGCYIATCIYGSYDCPEVWTLRRFRDCILASTPIGRAFIKSYYAISPLMVKWFGNTKLFQRFWRSFLDRMVAHLQKKGFKNTKYYD